MTPAPCPLPPATCPALPLQEAVADYDAVFNFKVPASMSLTEEQTGQQLSSWYQKEMAAYVAHNLDRPVRDFCLDCELSAMLKENW